MARLRPLLRLARISDRRWSTTTRSGIEQALGALFSAGCVFTIYRQLERIVTGPLLNGLAAERLLSIFLCLAWVLIPLSIRTSVPLSSLFLYPLNRRQRTLYFVFGHLQKPQLLALCAASLLVMAAELWLPHPYLRIVGRTGWFLLSALIGFGLGTATRFLQRGTEAFRNTGRTISRPFPFVRKELSYFSKTLDPYLALMLSLAVGYSEYVGTWLTPFKLFIPLSMIAMILSAAVLQPFALDMPSERERYKLFPVPYRRIVVQKHIALALLFGCVNSPMMAVLVVREPYTQIFPSILIVLLVLVTWLCSGVLLMQTPSAKRVRMAFGALSGEGMSLGLALGLPFLSGWFQHWWFW